jgi:hypothetical protein
MAVPATPPRRPAWKIAGVVVGLLLLLSGGAAVAIHLVAERRWTAMKADWQALLEEARLRGSARSPLRGEPLEGNAWADYTVALAEVRSLYDLESQAAPRYLKEAPQSSRPLVERVLARHPKLIDSVRLGARRTKANLELEWKEGALTIPNRHGSAVVAPLAVCLARFLSDAGRRRDAAELLIDTCRFAGDIDHAEDMAPGFEALRDLLQPGLLTREELAQVDRELEVLDREFPRRGHRVSLDLLSFGSLLLKTGHSVTVQLVGLQADPDDALWRYGYSGHLMKADAFHAIAAAAKELSDADERPWLESSAVLRKLTTELSRHPNPIAQTAPEEILASDLIHRGYRAQLRLLRVAAHYGATGDVLELDDPFGTKLRVRVADGSLRAWSVGPDGGDHNGTGMFAFDRDNPVDRDIVIEIRVH